MKIDSTPYKLLNIATGRVFEDSGWMMADPQSPTPSLIRAEYGKKEIQIKEDSYGIYKFADWLPIHKMLKGSYAPATYKSEALAAHMGLENLFITFNGWWPERGIEMQTCSFKETEAFSVCARLNFKDKILVVSSAGNTARAFARVCSENNIPIVITIPEENIFAMWFAEELNPCVKVICTPKGTDYFDAIQLGDKLCQDSTFIAEGGAKNVARRDGMGTTVLSAAAFIGRIPDAYFQAVGSGTGTIAAYEANLRLLADGRFGKTTMRLIPSQNEPFTPMYDAYMADSRALLPMDEDLARTRALQIGAPVLSNRKPPYSVTGGLYDALKASGGTMKKVTNTELREACQLFEKLEGIDIYSAAGVAVKSLEKAVAKGTVKPQETIMLNITGGGEKRFKSSHKIYQKQPDLIFPIDATPEEIASKVKALF